MGFHDRRETRGLRRREIPRLLEGLKADHLNFIALSERAERDKVCDIAAETNKRGM